MRPGSLLVLAMVLPAIIVFVGCTKPSQPPSAGSCEGLLNATHAADCLERLALSSGKADYCERINTSDPFNMGRMACYVHLAESTGNVSWCSIYSRYDSAAICIRTVAVRNNDSSLCALDGMEPDVCYLALAVKRSRVDVCDGIWSQEIKEKCRDEVVNGTKYYCLNYEKC